MLQGLQSATKWCEVLQESQARQIGTSAAKCGKVPQVLQTMRSATSLTSATKCSKSCKFHKRCKSITKSGAVLQSVRSDSSATKYVRLFTSTPAETLGAFPSKHSCRHFGGIAKDVAGTLEVWGSLAEEMRRLCKALAESASQALLQTLWGQCKGLRKHFGDVGKARRRDAEPLKGTS